MVNSPDPRSGASHPPTALAAARRPTWKRWLSRGLLILLLGPALIVALYTWLALSVSYSSGERAGYVQKFSRKGWVCKTWEGELAMVNLPGTVAEVFAFTVRDEAVAARINGMVGQRVALSYEQHLGLPTSCFGETSYFVVNVKAISQP
jgi:hypothetical protein